MARFEITWMILKGPILRSANFFVGLVVRMFLVERKTESPTLYFGSSWRLLSVLRWFLARAFVISSLACL